MDASDCEFLRGADLSARIRDVCGERDVDCAVAFWGVDMRKTLFPRWLEGGLIRIVCDISQNATCQKALRQLGAPNNPCLKVADSFHAKVYISSLGAVVCSANASDNGIGKKPGRAGRLLEAGMFSPPDSSSYKKAKAWFGTLFGRLDMVDDEALLSAPEHSGELRPRGSTDALAELPLLARLRRFPQNFSGIRIAVADGHIDDDKAERTVAERQAARGDTSSVADEVILQDGPALTLRPFTGPLLLLWRLRSVTRVYAYEDCSTWPPRTSDSVFGVESWKGFWTTLRQSAPGRRLTASESGMVGRLLSNADGEWLFDADAFAQRLEGLK